MSEELAYLGGAWILGGAMLSRLCGTAPFAKLVCFEDQIVLRLLWRRINIPRESVRCVHRCVGILFSQGIQIEHTIPDLNPIIVFWTFPARVVDDILSFLSAHHYSVDPIKTRVPWRWYLLGQ
jgi:hypothetical protein